MTDPSTPADVLAYYGASVEVDRLLRGIGALEFARTKELLVRALPARARVVDIGGGAGHYAEWLVEQGHQVELVEPVPLHVELARERAGKPPTFGVHEADARTLPFADDSFDAALLLGPLYHLATAAERVRAVVEAARVCRPGAVVAAAAISRYAPLLDTIRRGRIGDGRTFANAARETRTGRRVSAAQRTSPFPDAYFHLPDELSQELAAAGLEVAGVFGIEGPGWLVPDFDAAWRDPATRERLLEAARSCEHDRHVLAVSAHLLAVAYKPGPAED